MKYKCDMCKVKDATRFHETVRKSGGGGTIMNLCDRCMAKTVGINRQNRV